MMGPTGVPRVDGAMHSAAAPWASLVWPWHIDAHIAKQAGVDCSERKHRQLLTTSTGSLHVGALGAAP